MKNWNFINGWSLKTARVNGAYIFMMMTLLITSIQGHAGEQEALPMEFLEFLGEGIVIEDEYLDPVNYADIEQDTMSQNKAVQSETDKTTKQPDTGGEE